MALNDQSADEPFVWAGLAARQRTPVRVFDARMSVSHAPHPRNDTYVYHRFSRMAGPAQHLAVFRCGVVFQRGWLNVIEMVAPNLQCARAAAAIWQPSFTATACPRQCGSQHWLAEFMAGQCDSPLMGAATRPAGPVKSAAMTARSVVVSAKR